MNPKRACLQATESKNNTSVKRTAGSDTNLHDGFQGLDSFAEPVLKAGSRVEL